MPEIHASIKKFVLTGNEATGFPGVHVVLKINGAAALLLERVHKQNEYVKDISSRLIDDSWIVMELPCIHINKSEVW